jgi:diadenosine tetraphosphatase ApaH/serine/threonine PP2A family protein phosphatase
MLQALKRIGSGPATGSLRTGPRVLSLEWGDKKDRGGMRQAILSDIHSNLEALQACVAHAHAQGATHFACLGDCVGYGADPVPTIDLLLSLPHLLMIRGNHDEALFLDEVPDVPGVSEAIDWTCTQLAPVHCDLLEAAPYVLTVGAATYAHASAHAPEEWAYLRRPEQIHDCLAATDATVTFIGHVHVPRAFSYAPDEGLQEHSIADGVPLALVPGHRYVVNVGSVGQPRDGNNAASYALYDSDAGKVTLFRVAYDHARAAEKILAAGLDASFAERLMEGR